jgi:UDP-N-acetylmuramate--alanine ligase
MAGIHNMYNTLAAIGVGLAMGMSWGTIQKSLEEFKGVRRRLDKVGCIGLIPVFDDYAHHPTEIRATLSTLKAYKRRIIAVFQPHRYTRIQSLLAEFLTSFDDADILVVTRVYGAGEKPSKTFTDRAIYEALREKRCAPTMFAASHEQIVRIVRQNLTDDSLIVTLGAGNITNIPPLLIQEIGQE